uniref:Reverse transcriptase zinc-binding domain-containing protein n=1 Tax=Aegilops tauschii subsp. strangulata TaxID=200361 RepID=A0A453L5V2_AEGTS
MKCVWLVWILPTSQHVWEAMRETWTLPNNSDLMITYLGIPLTIRRPAAAQLQPLVDGIAGRLPAWKAGLMSKPGRLALVKSVLGAIPVTSYSPLHRQKRLCAKLRRSSAASYGPAARRLTAVTVMSTGDASAGPSRSVVSESRTSSALASP